MARPWKKRQKDPESAGQQNRRKIIGLVFQAIFFFMIVIIVVYVAIAAVLGSSLFVPRNAEEVLRSVEMPEKYQWISESARKIQLPGGYTEEQFGLRSVALSKKTGIFLANLYGVLPEPTLFISDKRATIRITESESLRTADTRDGALVTDACASEGDPRTPETSDDNPLPVSLLELPQASKILASNPRLIDDKATFRGERAWLIEFDPDKEMIDQMLWRPFLREALRGAEFADEEPWIETPEEAAALRKGDYDVLWSYAWVLRGTRELAQIRIRIDVPLEVNGQKSKISYHLLGHLFSSEALDELDRQNIGGRFFCGD